MPRKIVQNGRLQHTLIDLHISSWGKEVDRMFALLGEHKQFSKWPLENKYSTWK